MNKKILLICLLFSYTISFAQKSEITTETSTLDDLLTLDLSSLLNISLTSASKKKESALESPLSTTVITGEEIINSGATTLEDIFRLIPGVIVRETTNGNFDLHIRGLDNTPSHNFTFETVNTTTLVMINNQKVYNHLNGGTFWETLPVSLTDIEQIEVIRGPSTALYGPNAVSGVINIITKKTLRIKPFMVKSQVQGGNLNTCITNTSIQAALTPKLNCGVSFNSDYRNRNQSSYWNYKYNDYTISDSLYDFTLPDSNFKITPDDQKWSKPKLAKQKLGLNGFINYQLSDDEGFYLSSSYQTDIVQALLMESNTTLLTTRNSSSYLTNFHGTLKNFTLNASNIFGTQDIYVGDSYNPVKYDFNSTDIFAEYDLKIKNFTFKPGIQYQKSVYDDRKYIPLNEDNTKTTGLLNSKRELTTLAPTLRVEFKPTRKLRLIAAIRGDIYNVPKKIYSSYQVIGTYTHTKNHLIRFVASKANRGPTMSQMYTEFKTQTNLYCGNTNLNLLEQYAFEIGTRHILNPKFQTEFELYYNHTKGFSLLQLDVEKTIKHNYTPTIIYYNVPTVAKQIGLTSSFQYFISEKITVKPHFTIQYTLLENAPITTTTAISQHYKTKKHTQTPNFYGGVSAQFKFSEKLNLFTNFYYLAPQVFDFYLKNEQTPATKRIDLKISYKIWKQNAIFLNARNALNPQTNEFAFTDKIGGLYLIGVDLLF